MLSDPQTVTYNGTAKTLPVVGLKPPQIRGLNQSRSYMTADGEFRLLARQYSMSDGSRKTELELVRLAARDLDGNTTVDSVLSNGFGITVTTNPFNKDSLSEIALLQTALNSLVTSPVLNRLIGGEI